MLCPTTSAGAGSSGWRRQDPGNHGSREDHLASSVPAASHGCTSLRRASCGEADPNGREPADAVGSSRRRTVGGQRFARFAVAAARTRPSGSFARMASELESMRSLSAARSRIATPLHASMVTEAHDPSAAGVQYGRTPYGGTDASERWAVAQSSLQRPCSTERSASLASAPSPARSRWSAPAVVGALEVSGASCRQLGLSTSANITMPMTATHNNPPIQAQGTSWPVMAGNASRIANPTGANAMKANAVASRLRMSDKVRSTGASP